MRNTKKTSEYYGVSKHGKNSYQCAVNGILLGSNSDPLILAKIYDLKVKELRLNKRLNFPEYPENNVPNTKMIQLTQGIFAIVDIDDYEKLNQWKWNAVKGKGTFYAETRVCENGKTFNIKMHRFIMNFGPENKDIDHRNGNGLHNYKSNLRECENVQNCMNKRKRLNCSSEYKGVYFVKRNNNYSAEIKIKGKKKWLGAFYDPKNAAMAYNNAAVEYFGEFARLNVIETN